MGCERVDPGGGMAAAIRLLTAIGDDRRAAETALAYIDGMRAGILMASADNGNAKKASTRR